MDHIKKHDSPIMIGIPPSQSEAPPQLHFSKLITGKTRILSLKCVKRAAKFFKKMFLGDGLVKKNRRIFFI